MSGSGERSTRSGDDDPAAVPDELLARWVQQGSSEALEQLARRYLRPVAAVAASFLGDAHDAEDAAQETFLRAIDRIDSYDPRRPFAPWLYQIARNVARNRLDARARWRMEALPERDLASKAPSPDREAEHSEIRRRVTAELAKLPELRRTAFRLVDIDGVPVEEAAQLMGVTPATIRSHVYHARRDLRAALGDVMEGSGTLVSSPDDG